MEGAALGEGKELGPGPLREMEMRGQGQTASVRVELKTSRRQASCQRRWRGEGHAPGRDVIVSGWVTVDRGGGRTGQ
jgi:hypothetical protein